MSTSPFLGVVAIDGPSGSGKSTVSRAVARELGLRYLDTGAMYRAATVAVIHAQIDVEDAHVVGEFVRGLQMDVPTDPDDQTIRVAGADVTEAIRTPAVSLTVSALATNLEVRSELIARQQAIVADGRRIVLEGRDTTTVVAPHADVRILITADPQARVARRTAELHDEVTADTMSTTSTHVIARDAKDSTVTNFHTAAPGVHTLDTSHLSLAESIQAVLDLVAQSAAEVS